MRKEKKTNVMRILDKAKIPYIARSYEYKESNLSGTHALLPPSDMTPP